MADKLKITTDLEFNGKKELEDLISEYKEFIRVNRNLDGDVKRLAKSINSTLTDAVRDVNEELKLVPTDAYAKVEKNLRSAEKAVATSEAKFAKWSNEFEKNAGVNDEVAEKALNHAIEWQDKLTSNEALRQKYIADMQELEATFQRYVGIASQDDWDAKLNSVARITQIYVGHIRELNSLLTESYNAINGVSEISEHLQNLKINYGDAGEGVEVFELTKDNAGEALKVIEELYPAIKNVGVAMDEAASQFGVLAEKGELTQDAYGEIADSLVDPKDKLNEMLIIVNGLLNQAETIQATVGDGELSDEFNNTYGTLVAISDILNKVNYGYETLMDPAHNRGGFQDFVERGKMTEEQVIALNSATDAAVRYEQEMQKVGERIVEAVGKIGELQISDESGQSVTNMIAKIGQLKAKLDELKGQGKWFGDAEYDKAYQDLVIAKKSAEDYERALRKAALESMNADAANSQFANNVKTRTNSAISSAISNFKKLATVIKQHVLNAYKSLTHTITNLAHNFKLSSHGSSDLSRSLKRGLTMITKYVFGFRSLFFLVRRLRKAVKEGLENLVQFEGGTNDTNKAISALQDSLLYLKNAWAAAVAPVLNVVLPILSALIDKMAEVGNAVASFFAMLTGQETVIHAVKTEMSDYAKSLDSSAGSSGKASKAADKLKDRLAAFDDLNVLGKDDTTDPNKSAGGGGNPLDKVPSVDEMFKRVDTESKFAEMLQEAIASWDFTEVGRLIGLKLKGMFDYVNWADVQKKLTDVLNGIITFINGFFTTPGLFTSAGIFLANGLNTLVMGIKKFLDDIEWYEIFKSFGEGIRTFFENLDVNQILETVKSFWRAVTLSIKGLADGLKLEELLSTTEFGKISTNIANFIAKQLDRIPWQRIQTSAQKVAKTMIQILMGFIGNPKLGASLGATSGNLANLIIGVLNAAIEEASFTDIGATLGSFVSNLLTTLDFNSLKDLGSSLPGAIQDFINGVLDDVDWVALGEALVNHIIYVATHLGDDAENIGKAFATVFKIIFAAGSFVVGLAKGIGNAILDAIKKGIDDFNNDTEGMSVGQKLWEFTKRFAKALAKFFTGQTILSWINENIAGPIITSFMESMGLEVDKQQLISKVTDLIQHPFETAKEAIVVAISALKPKISSKWDDIKTYLSNNKDAIEGFMKNPFKVAKEAIITSVNTIKVKVSDAFAKIKEVVSQFGSAMWEDAKGGFSNFAQGVESFINLIIDGFNKLISVLNQLQFPIDDTTKELGKLFKLNLGDSIGFNIKPLNHVDIPALAQGAVIPPNREFLAMLGDQKSGTNIEAPLDTIKQALAEVMGNIQVENTGNAVMELDGQTFARLITPYVVSELDRRGYNVQVIGG